MIGAVDMANIKSYEEKKKKINVNNKLQKNFYEDKSLEKKNLGPYLAGLFEGDGHIQFSAGNNPLYPRSILVGITFNLKDLPLCEHLKTFFLDDETRIRVKEKNNACVLIINNKKGLIRFTKLVNGYLRSPKLYKFNQMIELMNKKYKLSLSVSNYDLSSLDSNSWLAGFIDADGGFQIRYTDKTGSKFRIASELRIEQRMIDVISQRSYKNLFTSIASFFNTKIYLTKHNNINYYMVRASNKANLKIVLSYLDKYPLYSSKYLDCLSWSYTVNLLLNNKAYLADNRLKILDLKNNMNNKRTKFNWDHLNKLR